MCSPTQETNISSDMCSPTWETHIPSDMSSPTQETHIPSDIPVDVYARLSAECSVEGLERSIIKVVWCQRGIFITI